MLIATGLAVVLAACSTPPDTIPPDDSHVVEDCSAPGDEDGNGRADCSDPICARAPACRPRCGDGVTDPGEQCDDGNPTNGDD